MLICIFLIVDLIPLSFDPGSQQTQEPHDRSSRHDNNNNITREFVFDWPYKPDHMGPDFFLFGPLLDATRHGQTGGG